MNIPPLNPVVSSNIQAVGFDPSRNILAVLFKSGGLWFYRGVPPEVYEGLLTAESVGKFFAYSVKPYYPGEPHREKI